MPRRLSSGTHHQAVTDWIHPVGTVYFEVIYFHVRQTNTDVPFEVRARIRESGEWGVEVFRPFAEATALADAIEELGDGNQFRRPAISALRADERQTRTRLVDYHTKHAFDVTAAVSELPTLKLDDVLVLMDREWTTCLGTNWKGDAVAPQNNTGYHNLFPPNYLASHVGNDRTSCMNCHDSAGNHATDHDIFRGWYMFVRGSGSDKIFSFWPQQRFYQMGIVEGFSRAKHSNEVYNKLVKE